MILTVLCYGQFYCLPNPLHLCFETHRQTCSYLPFHFRPVLRAYFEEWKWADVVHCGPEVPHCLCSLPGQGTAWKHVLLWNPLGAERLGLPIPDGGHLAREAPRLRTDVTGLGKILWLCEFTHQNLEFVSDCVNQPQWLTQALATRKNEPTVVCILGPVINLHKPKFPDSLHRELIVFRLGDRLHEICFSGAFMSLGCRYVWKSLQRY